MTPTLIITDGSTRIDLLSMKGWMLKEWSPSVPEPKSGGIFRSSPLVNGRRLAYRKMDNITDTFNIVGSEGSQNDMIGTIQRIQRLLEKATEYWTSGWQNEPVWIEAKGTNESRPRYATIVDYRLSGFGGIYQQPFFGGCSSATEAILVVEHMFWQETKPGRGIAFLYIAKRNIRALPITILVRFLLLLLNTMAFMLLPLTILS